MDREQMRLLQGARLKKLVHRVYHHTPFYRDKMQQMGLTPDDIDTIDDIVKLPFTTKQDLRDTYPDGLFAADRTDMVRIHSSNSKVVLFFCRIVISPMTPSRFPIPSSSSSSCSCRV